MAADILSGKENLKTKEILTICNDINFDRFVNRYL